MIPHLSPVDSFCIVVSGLGGGGFSEEAVAIFVVVVVVVVVVVAVAIVVIVIIVTGMAVECEMQKACGQSEHLTVSQRTVSCSFITRDSNPCVTLLGFDSDFGETLLVMQAMCIV